MAFNVKAETKMRGWKLKGQKKMFKLHVNSIKTSFAGHICRYRGSLANLFKYDSYLSTEALFD